MSKKGSLCIFLVLASLMLFGISRNCLADVAYTISNSATASSIGISESGYNLTLQIGNLSFNNNTLSYQINSDTGTWTALSSGTSTATIPNLGSDFTLYLQLDGQILNTSSGTITPESGYVTVSWNNGPDFTITAANGSPVPLPAPAILLFSGLVGLIGVGVRQKRNI